MLTFSFIDSVKILMLTLDFMVLIFILGDPKKVIMWFFSFLILFLSGYELSSQIGLRSGSVLESTI